MEASFTVLSGPFRGQVFPISRGKFLIGREQDCHLLLDSSFVSRHHCVLLMDDYALRLRDLGSKNGTYVNQDLAKTGERILAHGDTIRVGDLVIRIELNLERPMPAASLETDIIERDTTQFDNGPGTESKVEQPSLTDRSQNATADL